MVCGASAGRVTAICTVVVRPTKTGSAVRIAWPASCGCLTSLGSRAHFATVYAKPEGKPLVDSYVTEVSQDTWIFFPWDLELSFVEPIASGRIER